MRIVEIIPTLNVGGAEVFVTQLTTVLRTRGHDVELLCVSGAGPLLERLSSAERAHVHVLDRKRRFDPTLPAQVASVLRDHRADIVHTHLFTGLLWGALGSLVGPRPLIVHTQHGVHNEDESLVPWVRRALGYTVVDGIVACSNAVVGDIARRRYAPAHRVHEIVNGIPLASRPQATCDHTPIRVGTVGRLVPIKGQRYLIDAIAQLRDEGVAISLEIVGGGPEHAALQAQVERLGLASIVTLAGERSDIANRLASWDIFVLSSLSEAMPVSLLEAGAAALPLVVTDAGGAATLIDAGAGGIVVPPGDASALASAIRKVATHDPAERRALGAASRATVLARYDIETTAAAYERLFETLLSAAK